MHPASSVIIFTTTSGAGYGLLLVYGLLMLLGALPGDPIMAIAVSGVSFALVTFGLLISTFHLGHPERAWRAFSQWRSSWLSREGVASVLTYGPMIGLGLAAFFGAGRNWLVGLAFLAAVLSALTIFTTAMIYASLKPVRAWANGLVPVGYFLWAMATGLVLLDSLLFLLDGADQIVRWATIVALAVAGLHKIFYWRWLAAGKSMSTIGTATGLGALGEVSLFEAPHTEANYLMREMGYQLARKHARKLKHTMGYFILFALAMFMAGLIAPGMAGNFFPLLTLLPVALAVFIERWLFFAEARHTQALYYGAESA